MTTFTCDSNHGEQRPFAGLTVLMSGGSRGIGRSIALTLAAGGAQVALMAKTSEPHPHLEGTVHSTVAEVDAAGGAGLGIIGDVREDADVTRAVEETVKRFGGIDFVINNASAIDLSPTEAINMKRYDLMQDINVRGSFLLAKTALPHLRASAAAGRNTQILTLSPPLAHTAEGLDPVWLGEHLPYTIAKYGMSMVSAGLAAELKGTGVSSNALWPVTLIQTAAVEMLASGAGEQGAAMMSGARTPQIVADAAAVILAGRLKHDDGSALTGAFLTDEQVLGAAGVTDYAGYAVDPSAELSKDIFL